MNRNTIFIVKIPHNYSLTDLDTMKFGRKVFSTKLVPVYDTIWQKIPEGHNFHIHCYKNLKFHKLLLNVCVYCIGRCMGYVGNLSLVGLCYFQDVCHFETLLTFSAKLLHLQHIFLCF